ncbi:MAG: hypothetical protein K0Q83_671 [Deltaproteobacteria bacterium]|jgi:hypothetical protein|nr:hypothetical protein [Deltaproteobacteria bacterium]
MRKALISALSLSLSLSAIDGYPDVAQGQEHQAIIERILNPLPEFDPFEKPPVAPQFFPDEVDKRARELLIDSLTNRKAAIEEHVKFFQTEDRRLQKQHGSSTGLAEPAQDLLNNTINERERYLAAQRQALKNTSSPERKKYLQAIIDEDDLTRADQLTRQSSVNELGGVFNRLLGSVDLVGVASGNYVGAAAETAIGQAYSLLNSEMSVEERRALARHMDHLKRYPNDPRNGKIVKEIEELEKKKTAALIRKQLDHSKQAAQKGDTDKALFYAEIASYLDGRSKTAQAELQKLSRFYLQQMERQNHGLSAQVEKAASAEQQEDVEELLRALSLRDQQKIAEQAANLEKKYAGRPLAESARDALSVALEMQGRHDEAKKLIERLASSAKTPDTQKRAAALLQSPEYNLLATFQEARSERRAESVKYVLLGEDLLKKNLIYAAGAVAAAGPAGAVTLGAANAMMVGNNLINVLSNNPVSAQSVIDAGVAYVRNHPGSDSATEVYKILADTYEEKGMIDKAIGYHELAGTPKEKLSSLKQKAATALLNAATKSKGRGTQEYYLTTVIDQYPESPAAAEATKKLAELAKTDNHGLRMSKQFLKENPELFGPAGLGLKATLFDGNPRNMELADRGVNVTGGNELLIYYQTASGVRSQSYPLPRQTSERFFVTLRQKNHAVAMADAGQRAKGSVGGIKNLPMPIIQGARPNAGEPEQERDDTTFSFVREASAHAPAFPKVLDHEMLSENERNPGGKYSLPPIQGSVSASRFSMSGALPAGLWGNQIGIGGDHKGSFAGVQLPIPLLEGFMPVDFMVQGRPGGVSVYPRIHMRDDKGEDRELYK